MLIGLTFLLWLCIAGAGDIVYRKCFNWLIISGFIFLLIVIAKNPELSFFESSKQKMLIGGLGTFFVFLIFYIFGMMGAGDVKFGAVLGLWVGWELFLSIWALSCAFAVFHGMLVQSNLKYFFSATMNWEDGRQEKGKRFIPYVTYLAIATVIVLMLNK